MFRSPSDLAKLAQMKAQANQQPDPPTEVELTNIVQPSGQPVVEPNRPGGEGYSSPAGSGLGFGHEQPQLPQPGPPDSIMNDPNEAYKYLVQVCNIPAQQAATTVFAGPQAVEEAVLGFGHQQAPQAPPSGNPGGMANALMGVTNTVRGINGQQQDPTSAATSRASNMFNSLAGVTNTVRGINGQQPPQQQQNQQQQTQPPQESPNWGQNTNTMTAGSPPRHGGGNPGFSGMMNNTGDTMAALKALISNLSRR